MQFITLGLQTPGTTMMNKMYSMPPVEICKTELWSHL